MHEVLLGVTPNLLSFWLETKNFKELFYISVGNKVKLDERLKTMLPCSFISRAPRPLSDKRLS